MPIDYNSKDANNCWPEGDYEAELVQVLDKTSKQSGNAMQEWKVKAYHPDGRKQVISDYFVPPGGTFKLRQLAKAIDKEPEFESNSFQADDHEGATFKVHLIIEESAGFDDKNKIQKYLSANAKPAAPTIKDQIRQRRQPVTNPVGADSPAEFKKDDIPF